MNSEEAPEREERKWGRLERGWRKVQLIQELARGEDTQESLAKKYDCTPSAMSQFKDRHLPEIEHVRRNLEDEFAALWVAKKINRLAEYEADIDAINEALLLAGAEDSAAARAAKHRALRSVAEELGALPNRLNVTGEVTARVTYELVGVDMDKL